MNNNSGFACLSNTLLLITFLVLKLCNVIDWSWFWVLSPLWIPVAVIILIHILVYICMRIP
jgi:hypothetical protein